MHSLFTLNPKVSTALFTLIGFILIDELNTYEQNVLGNWLMLTSQVLTTNSASQELIEQYASNTGININESGFKNIYNPLFYDLDVLRDLIITMQPSDLQKVFLDLHKRLSKIEKIINEIYEED